MDWSSDTYAWDIRPWVWRCSHFNFAKLLITRAMVMTPHNAIYLALLQPVSLDLAHYMTSCRHEQWTAPCMSHLYTYPYKPTTSNVQESMKSIKKQQDWSSKCLIHLLCTSNRYPEWIVYVWQYQYRQCSRSLTNAITEPPTPTSASTVLWRALDPQQPRKSDPHKQACFTEIQHFPQEFGDRKLGKKHVAHCK